MTWAASRRENSRTPFAGIRQTLFGQTLFGQTLAGRWPDMPQGVPATVPDDGLTTRQRRNRPLLIVHTGPMKGKSTAAFGMALRGWNQGWGSGGYQFVKSAKWRVGEEAAFRALGRLHDETGEGGEVAWHKMGEGWSWIQRG